MKIAFTRKLLKKLTWLCASAGLVATVASAPAALVHRWSFTETNGAIVDSVGSANGSVVVLSGNSTRTNGAIRLGGGGRGTADYVQLPSGLVHNLTNVTIEVWAAPLSAQNWSRIFDFGPGNDTQAGTFFLSFCRGTVINQQRFEFGAPFVWQLDTGLATTLSNQYHYAATWSATGGPNGGGKAQWFRNGVSAGSLDTGTSGISAVDDAVLWLGRSQYPADSTANADYTEVRIYDHVLSQAQINANFSNGPNSVVFLSPIATNDSVALNPGAMALIDVLRNDAGVGAPLDPSSVFITAPPVSGTAQVKSDGRILYTHNGGPATSDQFGYRVKDTAGGTSQVATVSITISSLLRLANSTITISNTPPPVGYQLVDAFPNLYFTNCVALRSPPGVSNRLFVVERRGVISCVPDINAANPVRQVFLNIFDQIAFDATVEGELGLLSMAFHPGFATNGIFFVYYTAPNGGVFFDRLSRFTANPTNYTVATNTQQILINVVDEAFNHNGGDLHFGNDGYLYMSMGDEGDQYNFRQNSQRIDKDFYSGILRLDVDKKPGSIEPKAHTAVPVDGLGKAFYSIPPNNPFVNATSFFGKAINTNALRAEFWAVGLRHPWRISIDPANGEVWVGDVGQDRYEEVNVATNGGNYGWAYYEGTNLALPMYPAQPTLLTNPPAGLAFPLWQYTHLAVNDGGDPQYKGNSITGGVISHGANIPDITNSYVFADFEGANVWSLRRTNGTVAVQRLAGEVGISALGVDPGNKDVLLANYLQHKVKRLVRTDAANSGFPTKLSDTGIFADLATLVPNPGIVSYEPIISFWSDYALKRRWFCIPDLSSTVTFSTDANWLFPSGMKWIKHFDLETQRGNPATAKRIETRVIVKTDTGSYGVSYKWNDAGTEAFLVADGGTNFTVTVQDGTNTIPQLWEIPSRASCLSCHTPVAGHALSFNTRELNQVADMNGFVDNQIASLSQAGYFTAPVNNIHTLPAFADADNDTYSLEYRVRSYLAVNCVQCHQPGGAGPGTWDARSWQTMAQTGLINGAPADNGNNPTNRLIVPGDAAHSVVLQRIMGNGFSRMPPLATHQLDQASISLLTEWISTELSNRQDFIQWQIAYFGSTNNPLAAPDADPDGDGANNYYEYLTMTSPTNNGALWAIDISKSAGNANVSFPRLANRGFLVESSGNLFDWVPWNVPGNQIWFGASNEWSTVSGPVLSGVTNQFFRVRITEP